MGWSCSREASLTLEAIQQFCLSQTGQQNVFRTDKCEYFFETSKREHSDGAITGSIWKVVGMGTHRTGSFKIEGNGIISNGPWTFKRLKLLRFICRDGRDESVTLWTAEDGEVNDDNLWKKIQKYVDAFKPNGVNFHVSKALGYIPYPTYAEILDVKENKVLASWEAGAFQGWS